MIIYTCPECGTDLIETATLTNPPRRHIECPSCGWERWHEDKEEIIRIPYGGNTYKAYDFSDACEYCPNDPRNGGPGNCNCILGTPKITC